MSTTKTTAQVRGDLLADIEAVRNGLMPRETGAVLFAGYKEVNASLKTEVDLFKAALLAKKEGMEFAKACRLGSRVINGEES